jgi:hypothetical protein
MLTPEALLASHGSGPQFTCFTSTKVSVLIPQELQAYSARHRSPPLYCCTCRQVLLLYICPHTKKTAIYVSLYYCSSSLMRYLLPTHHTHTPTHPPTHTHTHTHTQTHTFRCRLRACCRGRRWRRRWSEERYYDPFAIMRGVRGVICRRRYNDADGIVLRVRLLRRIRQHASAYVSIRQRVSASAYASIRQHTSACVSICLRCIRQHASAYAECFCS